jgi:uncharacterized protein with HEPN domain
LLKNNDWNTSVNQVNDYLSSPEGMQKMAAVPWRDIKGLRNHIAHGYFNLDADIIFDVAKNEIPSLKNRLMSIRDTLWK